MTSMPISYLRPPEGFSLSLVGYDIKAPGKIIKQVRGSGPKSIKPDNGIVTANTHFIFGRENYFFRVIFMQEDRVSNCKLRKVGFVALKNVTMPEGDITISRYSDV